MNLLRKSATLVLALATVGTACSSGSSEDASNSESARDADTAVGSDNSANEAEDDNDSSDTPTDADAFRAEMSGKGEVVLSGFITDTVSESQTDVRFRDVGNCTGGNMAFGVFVDVDFGFNEEFGEDMGNTKYVITATAEPGTADGSTRGDVPVEVLVQSIGDVLDSDDDRTFEGPGTLTIGEPIIIEDEFFFRGTPYSISATLDVDGETLDVSVTDTIELVCN